MRTDALSLDQAPPLAVPVSFLLTAPLATIAAGAILALRGSAVLRSGWDPATLVLTHLLTLGFLTMTMVGALYQMTPVVAGTRVPLVRAAHLVHALLVVSLALLAWAGLAGRPQAFPAAFRLAGAALAIFLLPVGWAVFRTRTGTDTVRGMRLALVSLLFVGGTGLLMSETLAGRSLLFDRGLSVRVHLGLALLCWVGGLISAVSWQVLPMFYLCNEVPRPIRRATLWAVGLGGVGLLACLILPQSALLNALPARELALFAAAPAALLTWIAAPIAALRSMQGRRRRRPDASLAFWRGGLLCGPLTLALGLATHFSEAPQFALAFVWLGVWGWAGLIVHGMLHRILPFLAWFHLLSRFVGRTRVPSARGLLPAASMRLGLALHLLSLLMGTAAILTGSDPLARLAGVATAATGASLVLALALALLRSRRAAAAAALSLSDASATGIEAP